MTLKNFQVLLMLLLLLNGCKKTETKPPERGDPIGTTNDITSFLLAKADNPFLLSDVNGIIGKDTIIITLLSADLLKHLVPTIITNGKSVDPASKAVQDFSNPVKYTVTAENGNKKIYTVVAHVVNANKNITGFVFTSAKNPVFTADVEGEIGADTIIVHIPEETDLSALVPTITIDGVAINPVSDKPQDFTDPVKYVVTASDGSVKQYTVIVSSNLAVFVGSDNGNLYALDAITGGLIWRFHTDGQISNPVYANGYVYAGNGYSYFALDARTKAIKWRNSSFSGWFSAACVADKTVYVGYHQQLPVLADYLCAFDEATGAVKWMCLIDEALPYAISAPTAANGSVYICDWLQGLAAVDASTGKLKWRFTTNFTTVKPCVYKDLVIIAGGEGKVVAAINESDGSLRWSYLGANTTSGPVVVNDTLFVGGYSFSVGRNLYAFNPLSGATYWYAGAMYGANSFSTPFVYHNKVFAGNDNNLLYSFESSSGSIAWTIGSADDLPSPPSPVVSCGVVFTNRQNNNFLALDARNGAIKWSFEGTGLINTDPCLADVSGNSFYPGH